MQAPHMDPHGSHHSYDNPGAPGGPRSSMGSIGGSGGGGSGSGGAGPSGNQADIDAAEAAADEEAARSGKSRTKECRCSKCILAPEGFREIPTSTASDHATRDKVRANQNNNPSMAPPTLTPIGTKVPGRKRGRPSNAQRAAEAAAAAAAAGQPLPVATSSLQFALEGMGAFQAATTLASGSGTAPGDEVPAGTEAKPYAQNWSAPPKFLAKYLKFPSRIPGQTTVNYDHPNVAFRPYITLTWAQSIDAKIAGPGGARVILSGKESMEMTHWMRAMHHAIVIGVNTLMLDNPRLQINLLSLTPNLSPPLIYILDPNLRTPTNARILTEWNTPGQTYAARPTILCGAHMVWTARYRELEAAGAAIFGMQLDKNGHIPPQGVVNIFTSLGIRSAMVEGGSRVLSSFLHAPRRDDGTAVVDSVVVTVAPMFIGSGVGTVPPGGDVGLPLMKPQHTISLGKDSVMFCTL